jgi:hypothetical protein
MKIRNLESRQLLRWAIPGIILLIAFFAIIFWLVHSAVQKAQQSHDEQVGQAAEQLTYEIQEYHFSINYANSGYATPTGTVTISVVNHGSTSMSLCIGADLIALFSFYDNGAQATRKQYSDWQGHDCETVGANSTRDFPISIEGEPFATYSTPWELSHQPANICIYRTLQGVSMAYPGVNKLVARLNSSDCNPQ